MSNTIQDKGPIVNPGLCRCCGALRRCRILNVEYTWQGRKEVYSEMFGECFGLVFSHLEGEEMSCLICSTCVTRLRDANLFREQVLQNEEKLLASYVKIHEDVKIKKIKPEVNYIKTEVEFNVDENADDVDTRMSDNEYNGTEPQSPIQMDTASEESNLIVPEKLDKVAGMEPKSPIQIDTESEESNLIVPDKRPISLKAITSKRSNLNRSDVKHMDSQKMQVTKPMAPVQMKSKSETLIIEIEREKKSLSTKAKRRNLNVSNVKQTAVQKIPDRTKPPGGIYKIINNFIKSNVDKDRSFRNAVTIVENSYACPFRAIFNTYHCIYCTKKFIEPDELREHTLSHDPIGYKEKLKIIRQRNNKCYIDMQRIDCRLCDEKIDDYNTFQVHITKVHGKELYPKTSDNKDDFIVLMFILTYTNLKCMECENTYTDLHSLKLHMADHFGKCVCDICGMHFFEDSNLKAHLKSHKSTESSFTCTECGKSFRSKYTLNIHIARVHTKESPYFCNLCDESFFTNMLRRRHMVDVHNEGFMFKCKSCDKVYNNRKQFVAHNRQAHLKILKHECTVCKKRFVAPAHLREHMYCHTGERNYRCEHCGKSYPRMKALKVHLQSHNTEKKYKCNMCNASYSQNVCLKNHVKRQHQNFSTDE